MGAIAPTAKKLWGDAPKSPHRNFAVPFFHTLKWVNFFLQTGVWFSLSRGCRRRKCTVKITNVSLCKWQKEHWFQPEYMHQKRLAVGLAPDPLGELSAPPVPQLDLRGRVWTRKGEREMRKDRRGMWQGRERRGEGGEREEGEWRGELRTMEEERARGIESRNGRGKGREYLAPRSFLKVGAHGKWQQIVGCADQWRSHCCR